MVDIKLDVPGNYILVGGGISTVTQARELVSLGADKISLNTAAVRNPSLIAECAGCRVTDRSGAAIRFNAAQPRAEGVIAAPPALHGAILEQLRP